MSSFVSTLSYNLLNFKLVEATMEASSSEEDELAYGWRLLDLVTADFARRGLRLTWSVTDAASGEATGGEESQAGEECVSSKSVVSE